MPITRPADNLARDSREIDARRGCPQDEDVPMSKLSSFVWSIADQLRGPYHPNDYGLVILPMTILYRMDAILDPHREQITEIIDGVDGEMRRLSLMRKAT